MWGLNFVIFISHPVVECSFSHVFQNFCMFKVIQENILWIIYLFLFTLNQIYLIPQKESFSIRAGFFGVWHDRFLWYVFNTDLSTYHELHSNDYMAFETVLTYHWKFLYKYHSCYKLHFYQCDPPALITILDGINVSSIYVYPTIHLFRKTDFM